MPNKTLDQLRGDLRARMGFMTQGAAAGRNEPILNSFLHTAYHAVWHALEAGDLRWESAIVLQPGQRLYDWRDGALDREIDPGMVRSIHLQDGTISWQLHRGITSAMRANADVGDPTCFDHLNGQLEVWPTPDAAGPVLKIYHQLGFMPLVNPTDRPVVDDELILLHALFNAKAHYRHADSTAVAELYKLALRQALMKAHEGQRYIVEQCAEDPGHWVRRRGDGSYNLMS